MWKDNRAYIRKEGKWAETRIACYLTVYITSNIPLEQQYPKIQRDKLETWNAFLRRIHTATEFRKDGTIREVPHETV